MVKYRGRNIVSIVSSVIFGIIGLLIFLLGKGQFTNIIGIAFIIMCMLGFVNYYKYSIVLDSNEIRIVKAFKSKTIKYKDIVKIFTVHAGRTTITYIVDKYMEKGKWYIRGTYPPAALEKLNEVQFNDMSELITINSYVFEKYHELLSGVVKKVKNSSQIDSETWRVINSK